MGVAQSSASSRLLVLGPTSVVNTLGPATSPLGSLRNPQGELKEWPWVQVNQREELSAGGGEPVCWLVPDLGCDGASVFLSVKWGALPLQVAVRTPYSLGRRIPEELALRCSRPSQNLKTHLFL